MRQRVGLHKALAVRHGLIDRCKYDRAGRIGESQGENFGNEFANLARWEVDYRHNLTANQLLGRVVDRDLGGGFLHADLGTEIDAQLDCWLACFWIRLRLDHRADADVYRKKIIEGDFCSAWLCHGSPYLHRYIRRFYDRPAPATSSGAAQTSSGIKRCPRPRKGHSSEPRGLWCQTR